VREALALCDGTTTRAQAIAETALRTRQYARRQRKWFAKETWWTRFDAADPTLVSRVLDAMRHAKT
jgi:tRNA dimethylallyltransferase